MPLRSLVVRLFVLLGGLGSLAGLLSGRARRSTQRGTSGRVGRGGSAAPPSLAARGAGHETEDMSGPLMARLLLGLGVTVAAVVGLMVFYVRSLSPAANGPALTAQQTQPIAPPPPNLQAAPLEDIGTLRRREAALLDNYAWIDPERTRARIPVSRAMALLLGQPLDPAPATEAPR